MSDRSNMSKVERPEWPTSKPTAAELIHYAVEWGSWLNGLAWGYVEAGAFNEGEVEKLLRYSKASSQMQHMFDMALLLKALVEHAPAQANEAAGELWSAADAGDSYGEWLWEWARDEGLDGDALYDDGKATALQSVEGDQ